MDQVADIRNTVNMSGNGPAGSPEVPSAVSYNSIVTRAIGGIRVVESHAWARFDSDGDVVAEDVYWPELPAAVVSDANALSLILGDPAQRAAFLAKLPDFTGSDVGSVAIRHTSEFERSPLVVRASYDAYFDTGHGGYVRHFAADGGEFRLPQELRQAVETPR